MRSITQQGMDALKSGNTAEARHYLKQALQEDHTDIQAWFALSKAVDIDADKTFCLETMLRLDPGNEDARRELAKIKPDAVPPVQTSGRKSDQPAAVTGEEPKDYTPPFIFSEEELAKLEPFSLDGPLNREMGTAVDAEREEEIIAAAPEPNPQALLSESPLPPPTSSIQEEQPAAAPETIQPASQRKKVQPRAAAKSTFKPWMWAVLGGMLLLIILVILGIMILVLNQHSQAMPDPAVIIPAGGQGSWMALSPASAFILGIFSRAFSPKNQ